MSAELTQHLISVQMRSCPECISEWRQSERVATLRRLAWITITIAIPAATAQCIICPSLMVPDCQLARLLNAAPVSVRSLGDLSLSREIDRSVARIPKALQAAIICANSFGICPGRSRCSDVYSHKVEVLGTSLSIGEAE
jgi:hypothetical protein